MANRCTMSLFPTPNQLLCEHRVNMSKTAICASPYLTLKVNLMFVGHTSGEVLLRSLLLYIAPWQIMWFEIHHLLGFVSMQKTKGKKTKGRKEMKGKGMRCRSRMYCDFQKLYDLVSFTLKKRLSLLEICFHTKRIHRLSPLS